jgi:hypothetical protein
MKLLDKEGREVVAINFGMCEIGKTHEFTYYLFNDTPYYVENVSVSVPYEGVIVQAPTTMEAETKAEVKFVWMPPLNHKKALTTVFKLRATEVYK